MLWLGGAERRDVREPTRLALFVFLVVFTESSKCELLCNFKTRDNDHNFVVYRAIWIWRYNMHVPMIWKVLCFITTIFKMTSVLVCGHAEFDFLTLCHWTRTQWPPKQLNGVLLNSKSLLTRRPNSIVVTAVRFPSSWLFFSFQTKPALVFIPLPGVSKYTYVSRKLKWMQKADSDPCSNLPVNW